MFKIYGDKAMFRVKQTVNGPKLVELSIKQREMLLAYYGETSTQITWREFVQEGARRPQNIVPAILLDTPDNTPKLKGV